MRKAAVAALGVLAFAAPAAAQQHEPAEANPWKLTFLAGVGGREISSELYAAPLVGFSGSRRRGDKVELGVEAFALLPTAVVVSPSPVFVPTDGEGGGTTQLVTRDTTIAGLFRMNYWLTSSKVRPYLSIGAGVHVSRRAREATRTFEGLPGEQARVITIEDQEVSFGLSTLFAVGVDIPLTGHWSVRPEARLPIPAPYVSVATLGLGVAIAYNR